MRLAKLFEGMQEAREGSSLENIPIDAVRPNPYQPRRVFSEDALMELAGSIKQMGLLQPITVRRIGAAEYELIAGERRLRASKLAGMERIKAIVLEDAIDRDMATFALIENLQRENLHFFEEAEGYQALIREHGFTQDELARRISKNQSTIANKLRILRLSRAVKERIAASELTERHARSLLRLHDEGAQLRLLDTVIEKALSVKATEELVQQELRRMYGEEEDRAKVIHLRADDRIYVNTVKKALAKIEEMGVRTDLEYEDKGDCLEIRARVYTG